MQMDSRTTHNFVWYDQCLENVSRFVYLGWLIARKARNIDDEHACRQAGRFYAAAHEITQSYDFVKRLPWKERVNFAKCFGSLYAPEAYTSLSAKALQKLRAAHRYLFMRITGWTGIESVEAGSSTESCSIGTDDSAEEYYDIRSRWLYAFSAAHQKTATHRRIAGSGDVEIEFLHPAPTIGSQLRQARHRVSRVISRMVIPISLEKVKLSKSLATVLAPG